MAKHKGKEGVIKVGNVAVAQIRSITVNDSAESIETTTLNDDAKSFVAGTVSWDASADVYFHESDVGGQDALAIGTLASIKYYPIGESAGSDFASGDVLVTGRTMTNAQDGIVELSLTLQGSGALTWGDAA
jgi:predicted secreted protein